MLAKDILIDGFGRVREEVHTAVGGLAPEGLNARPGEDANSVSWLVWHLTRVQDDHVADAAGTEQVWLTGDWAKRFGLDLPRADTGYGHTSAKVARVRVESGDLLLGYYDAVHERTLEFIGGLAAHDFERVVDERWDPPVTLGVRLISILSDDLQHVGQAAYARGLLQMS
ncbi:mycothiol transferase [Streptomyces sp. NPDC002516]